MVTAQRPDPCHRWLRERMTGDVIVPGHPEYESARRVWNGMIDKHPAAIARCGNSADVALAVAYGREAELDLAVRGGGHNVSGRSVCDDGLVIDLSAMDHVRVDREAGIATAGGGATWGMLDAATGKAGLATTGGLVSSTGIGGLTLGGGVGWLMRQHGLACDNLVAAELVTADGATVIASLEDDDDLLWALRGGGGNFGIATSLSYSLHPVSTVLGGMIAYPLTSARRVLRYYADHLPSMPDEVTAFINLISLEDGSVAVAIALCCLDTSARGLALTQPYRQLGASILDTVAEQPYPALQQMFDNGCPSGRHNYWKSNYLSFFGDEAFEVMIDHMERVTSPYTTVDIEPFGGAVGRRGPTETAFPHRGAQANFLVCTMWLPEENPDPHLEWTYSLWHAMAPFFASSVYVNYLDGTGNQELESAYGPNLARLRQVKDRADPDNLFRGNQNIAPASGTPPSTAGLLDGG